MTSQVSGKIAQLGARLVDSVAQKLARDFFAKFNELMQATVTTAPQLATLGPALSPKHDVEKKQAMGSSWRWFITFAVGMSALLTWILLNSL